MLIFNCFMKPKAVIFDIDGVLAEKSPERDYREYDKVDLDKPIQQGFELLNYYYNSKKYELLFISGRKELCREKTIEFIDEKIFMLSEIKTLYYNLFMRANADHRPGYKLKKEIYEKHIKDKYDVVAVFDDDKECCRMFKEQGLFVFQVGTQDDFCL